MRIDFSNDIRVKLTCLDVRDKYDQIVDKETVSSLITKAKEVRGEFIN